MSKDKALKLALEALEFEAKTWKIPPTPTLKAITALREALTERPAQQEPVAWMCHPFGDEEVEYGPHQECENCIPLYTSPPAQRKENT